MHEINFYLKHLCKRMCGGPHRPLYVLQELIGIKRGKGEKNIWFGRLEGFETYMVPKHDIRPIFSDNEETGKVLVGCKHWPK
jgi:hypothetical protein